MLKVLKTCIVIRSVHPTPAVLPRPEASTEKKLSILTQQLRQKKQNKKQKNKHPVEALNQQDGWDLVASGSLILWTFPTAGNRSPVQAGLVSAAVFRFSVIQNNILSLSLIWIIFGWCEFYEVCFTVWCRKHFRSSTSNSSDRAVSGCLVDWNKKLWI